MRWSLAWILTLTSEYETFLVVKEQNAWDPTDVMDEVGHLLPDFALWEPKNVELNEPDDQDKIETVVARMGQPGQARALAKEWMQQRRALRQHAERYKAMVELYGGAKSTASLLSTMLTKATAAHWDLLQYM